MAKILIIEDDLTFSQLLEGFLKKHGHEPYVVHDVKSTSKKSSNNTTSNYF
ncbi:hypothetical protein [Pedobacter sp. NJ-S-72]